MGTTAIAAQAMTNIFENVNGVFGIGTGIGLMTVVGQCIGAKHYKEAKYYMVKLTVIAEVGLTISCLLVYAAAHPVTLIAGMEAESAALCMQMICGNYDCKTGCLGAFICTCIRTACRRRCPLFNDSFRNYDVVLQGCPLYLSCKSIWHGTNGSLDWYVRRLVYPLRNLFGQIF